MQEWFHFTLFLQGN